MRNNGIKILGVDYNLGNDDKIIPLDDWYERGQDSFNFNQSHKNSNADDNYNRVVDGYLYPSWQYAHLFHKKIYVPNYLIPEVISLAELFPNEKNFEHFITAWAKYLYVDRLPELNTKKLKIAIGWLKSKKVPFEFSNETV